MKTLKLFVLAAVLAVSPACKKDKAKEPAKTPDTTGSAAVGSATPTPTPTPDPTAGSAGSAGAATTPDPTAGSAGSAAAAAPAEDTGDWIKVFATHVAANPADPVEVKFEKFKVVKATFDPAKIEGGTAQLEIDLSSLKTSDPKRDEHLMNPDYLDVKKFPTATVDINNVKKKDDKTFTADANVKVHGVSMKYPVTFQVVEAKDDWVRIKGEHTFKRLDFKVGRKPGPDQKKDDGVADELKLQMQLTLKKS